MKRWPNKDPDEICDFSVDWTQRLAGDTLQQSSWVLPTGLVKQSDSMLPTSTIIWLSGGDLGETYVLTNRVITMGGRTYDQSVRLRVKAK
jgi:hypothetical protein